MIGRSELSNLEKSTLETFFKVAALMGYQIGQDFHYNSQKHIIKWSNDSQTILMDLQYYPSDPDFIRLGSTEFTDAFIDEANEVTEKAFDIVNSRIRWMLHDYDLVPKILLTANPGPGWLKEKYVLDRDNVPVELQPYQKFIRALVDDNPDEAFTDLYKQQLGRMGSEYDKARLLFGEWDAEPSNSSPFAPEFDPKYHVSDLAVFDPMKPLIISIDFNIQPFSIQFSHNWTDSTGQHDHTFDEAEINNGSIPAMADYIRERYGKYLAICQITGDAMGRNKDITQRDNASLYLQLIKLLHLRPEHIKLPVSGNPLHVNSKAECNHLLWQATIPGSKIDIKINPRCKGLIRDMKSVQWDDLKGEIVKKNRKQEKQRADLLDGTRYRWNVYFRPYLNRIFK